jgi:putative oxidoreductase
MATIEIDESTQPRSVTLAQALLRSVVGGILIAHGAQKLAAIAAFSDTLVQRFGVMEAEALAYAVAGIELAAGAGLVLGWFTRFSGFVLVCASALAFTLEYLQAGNVHAVQTGLELGLVLVGIGTLFMIVGGGPLSLDTSLRERRRLKAIENDAIWSRPPYVPAHPVAD